MTTVTETGRPKIQREPDPRVQKAASTITAVLAAIGMGIIAILFFFPLIWMVASSFKSNSEIFTNPFGLPTEIDFDKWVHAFQAGNIGRYALNSVIVTGVSVTLILALASAAAYAFSRYRFPGRMLFLGVFALGLLLPLQSYFVAQSTMFRDLAITDTRWALIIPYTGMGLPLAVYLLKMFLDGLPEELFDAARIDGAGEFRMYAGIAVPLLKPGLATVAIFSALNCWNEFLLALLYIQDDSLKTIPTGLLAFSSRYLTDYSMLFSALSIVTLPMIAIYVVFNRQMVAGITAGSLK